MTVRTNGFQAQVVTSVTSPSSPHPFFLCPLVPQHSTTFIPRRRVCIPEAKPSRVKNVYKFPRPSIEQHNDWGVLIECHSFEHIYKPQSWRSCKSKEAFQRVCPSRHLDKRLLWGTTCFNVLICSNMRVKALDTWPVEANWLLVAGAYRHASSSYDPLQRLASTV